MFFTGIKLVIWTYHKRFNNEKTIEKETHKQNINYDSSSASSDESDDNVFKFNHNKFKKYDDQTSDKDELRAEILKAAPRKAIIASNDHNSNEEVDSSNENESCAESISPKVAWTKALITSNHNNANEEINNKDDEEKK